MSFQSDLAAAIAADTLADPSLLTETLRRIASDQLQDDVVDLTRILTAVRDGTMPRTAAVIAESNRGGDGFMSGPQLERSSPVYVPELGTPIPTQRLSIDTREGPAWVDIPAPLKPLRINENFIGHFPEIIPPTAVCDRCRQRTVCNVDFYIADPSPDAGWEEEITIVLCAACQRFYHL